MNHFDQLKNEKKNVELSQKILLRNDYLIKKEGVLEIYYAPFEYINSQASVIIVGITPGWQQMLDSFSVAIESIHNGLSKDEVLRNVKKRSSFAGSMRKNLIQMLDELKLNEKLNIKSSLSLFKESNHLLHTTSALKYPVFKNGKNYTGSSPSPIKNSFLWEEINNGLVNEMSLFKSKLIIPLGKTVSEILSQIKSDGNLNENILLDGFPHPSGANGHRKKQFQMNRSDMAKKIKDWKINK
tara:strand:+ start:103 stop:825 length:723 start_codon:yes stop_codon:yes gene_type:complete